MKILFGEERKGYMTSRGILIIRSQYIIPAVMKWKLWGVICGTSFIGCVKRVGGTFHD